MDTPQMHTMFRQYAQQMGMQNVRAILPEQIDLVLNTSQMDIINQIIKENISVTNDRVITDNSKIGQINALRLLYTVTELDMSTDKASGGANFIFSAEDYYSGKMSTRNSTMETAPRKLPDYMFLVDFSINYKKAYSGFDGQDGNSYATVSYDSDKPFTTNFFPVRLIDDSFLADTLNDFVLKPRLRSPIIVNYTRQLSNEEINVFDIYIDEFHSIKTEDKDGLLHKTYVLENNLVPFKLRMSYIAKPKDISFKKDIAGENQACQLPEYLHVDVVKHAVDIYHAAVSGSLMSAQASEQNAQRENVRNNYRNEGNA